MNDYIYISGGIYGLLLGVIIFFIIKMYVDDKKKTNSVKQRRIQDVKVDEYIRVETSRSKEPSCLAKCVNNDAKAKKIALQFQWGNYQEAGVKEFETIVFSYKNNALSNFSVLNPIQQQETKNETNTDYHISELSKMVTEAIEKEEYEKVREIKTKVTSIFTHDKAGK